MKQGIYIALTIAGSDSGGGAGIQADLKTFHQFGVFGTSVITAVTAQNTVGVRAWEPVSPALIAAQLDAVAEDLKPRAFKTGMLGTAETVRVVAEGIGRHHLANYVLDPVMVATAGQSLLESGAGAAMLELLLPLAALVTPNLDEATALTGLPVRSPEQMEAAGRVLLKRGAKAVLMKGGHLPGGMVDLLVLPRDVRAFVHERLETTSTHGTGCTLAAAITAGLASAKPLEEAVTAAIDYVQRAIKSAPPHGGGHGPLNHFA